MTEIVALEALVARIRPGQSLAIPVDNSGVAMAATAALLEAGIGDLKLICVPISGMQADLLIGAGAVAAIETSAVSLGEAGGAPRFPPACAAAPSTCATPPARRSSPAFSPRRRACRSCRSPASSAATS